METVTDQVTEELRQIEDRDGIITPEAVVEFAKNKKTALHSQFEWDDKVAGHQYRLWQARYVIDIKAITIIRNDVELKVRAFHHFKADDKSVAGYRHINSIMSDEELMARMLEGALRELQTFRKKYKDLQKIVEWRPVFDVIDTVLQ